MKTTMSLKRIRIAPRKMRMVVDLVRGKKVVQAKDILRFRQNRGAKILLKFLEAAVASARTLGQGDELNLSIAKIAVDEGPKLKRWRPRAKGRAYPIQKKVSHVTLVLDEVKGEKSAQAFSKATKVVQEPELVKKVHDTPKVEKPKFKAVPSEPKAPTKTERGIQRFFRRKAI